MRLRRLAHRILRLVRTLARRFHAHAPSLLLAATAAGVAYAIASSLFGSQNAVFAPVAAVVATGLSAGQRTQRALEISLGVVLGLAAAELLSRWLGIGPLQLAAAVLLAMTGAVVVRPSGLVSNQAAVAAIFVMALVPYLHAGPWVRLGDALVGGVVAVILNATVAPDPCRAARAITGLTLGRLTAVLDRLARALEAGSLADAEAALEELTALDSASAEIGATLAAARERISWRGAERRQRPANLEAVEAVANRVVIMLATSRGLCRAVANFVRHADRRVAPTGLVAALDELIEAVTELQSWVAGHGSTAAVRSRALGAARTATAQLPGPQITFMLVGHIRSAAIDLWRATGATQSEAVASLEQAAGRADGSGT